MRKTKHFENEALRRFCACVISLLLALNANAQVTKSLWVGETYTCDATSSTLGSITDVSWSSSGGYISLTGSGLYRTVTATQYWSGTASVTCSWRYTLYYGGKQERGSRTWYFTCTENPVSISPTNMEMIVGETRHVSYSHRYSNNYTSNAQAYFSCSSTCVSVSKDGTVTALKPGTAYINVYSKISNAANAPYCKVTVKEATPTGISLPNSLSLIVGESKTITPTVYPSGADYSLTWISSDASIATVTSSGSVTGKKVGTVRITAEIDGYGYSDFCNVTVEKPTLTLSANPSGGLLEKGATVTLTASNKNAAIHYTLDGSTPNQNSTRYIAPIAIDRKQVLKAIAYHDDYKTSNVLTANYEVTSLKVVGTNPENGATDLGRNTTPSVTFNTEIKQGDNFADIKLMRKGSEEVVGERFISGNTLYFVSKEYLDDGTYRMTIPLNSITGSNGESNLPFEIQFVTSSSENNIIKVGSNRILKSDNTLYAWGSTSSYNYPSPNYSDTNTPFILYDDIDDYDRNYPNNYILKSDGVLMGWGGNFNHYENESDLYKSICILGDGTKISRKTPVEILKDVKNICHGSWHMGAIKNDNSLWLWGRNACGQIGNGTTATAGQLSPVKVLEDVKEVSLGTRHTVALKNDGSVWVWGGSTYIGTSSTQKMPLKKMTDVAAISSQYADHVLVLKQDGTVWSFGQNTHGEIGDGTTTNRSSPVKILSDAKYIEANSWQNIVIQEDGSLWRWGLVFNISGFPNSDREWHTPKKILDDVVSAHASTSNCFALKKDGTLWGMGDNDYGQLGNGTTELSTSMVEIMEDITQFWMSGSQIYALKKDGSLWGWGLAPIGDGTNTKRLSPVKIMEGNIIPPLEEVILETDNTSSYFINEKYVFQAHLTPSNGKYTSMTWSVDDEDIATISQRGVLTAKAVGTTTVRLEVETEDNKFVRTQKITVMEPKAEDKTLEIAKYATFYDSQSAYTLPSGLTASVVTGVNNEKLTYKVIAEGGKSNNVIPKGVAVMLTSKKKETSSYTLKPTDNDATYGNTNWLKGSDEATTTTSDGGNSWFYKLSYGPSGSAQSNVFGWYWGAANGGAFSIAGHKAWLAVPTSAGANTRSYIMEDEATSIVGVEMENPARTNDNYYDLQGRHISKPTSKGIYIHHGKKYIVK